MVPKTAGRPGVSRRPISATKTPMKERTDHVVRIDAPHPLHVATGARLPVRDDRQRFEGCWRQPSLLPRGVRGQPRADRRGRDELPRVVVVLEPDPPLDLVESLREVRQGRLGLEARHTGQLADLGRAQRTLGDEQQSLAEDAEVVGSG